VRNDYKFKYNKKKLLYLPQRYQVPFHRSSARFKNIAGGVRSGKTYTGTRDFFKRICLDLAKFTRRCEKDRFLHYWIVTPNYPIGKVVMRELFATIKTWDERLVRNWRASLKELWLYPNILIEFKSADNPTNLVSAKIYGVLIDEIARIKAEAWRGGIRQRLTDERGWGIFCTTPLGRNWYYNEIVRRGDSADELYDKEFKNFRFLTKDNKYIPRGEIEAAKRQLPPKYFRREYEASFENFFGQIFETFDRKVHVYPRSGVDVPTKFSKLVCGVDWGYATPGCMMVFGKTGDTRARYFELETVHKDHMLISNPNGDQQNTWLGHAKRLDEQMKKKYGLPVCFYPGKDQPEHIDVFQKAGLNVKETDYDVIPGINTMNGLYGEEPEEARIFYRKDVPDVVFDEAEQYQWATDKDEDDLDKPHKKNDHSCDAARYALHPEEKSNTFASGVIEAEPDWYDPSTYMKAA
jgi:hypothetical protein